MRIRRIAAVLKNPSKIARLFFMEHLPTERIAQICGFLVLGLSFTAFAQWMAPSSAVGFGLLGLALISLSRPHPSWLRRQSYRVLVSLSIVLALIKVAEYVVPLHLDSRMSPITAALFILSGASFLMLGESLSGTVGAQGSWAAFAVFLADLLVFLGYLYRAPLLYSRAIIPIALPAALSFLFLSVGQLALTSETQFPLRLFVGSSAKALLLRTFLPVALVGVLTDGILRNLIGRTWNPAWVSLFSAVVVGALVVAMGSEVSVVVGDAIDQAEEDRDQAELALQKSHSDLAQSNSSLESEIDVRRQTEQLLRRQLVRMEALRNIDLTITASLDARVTLNVLLETVTTQLNVDAAAIHLFDPRTNHLEYGAERGFPVQGSAHLDLQMGDDLAWQIVTERRSVRTNLPILKDRSPRARRLAEEGFPHYLGIPLMAKGNVRGVLEIFNRSPLPPEGEWLGFLETLTGQAAIALDNASLFEDLQRSNAALIRTYDATLEGWSKALDLRDQGTEGHSLRVADMTVRMARALGMEEDQLVHVRRGALLHDIGKMGIPDRILLKAEALTPEEWKVMQKHPVYAFEMLSPIAYLRPALDIPYGHHERWDGTGYPRGLRGEQIPLSVRIFSLVDIWDALSYERPYHPAWPREKVAAHLRSLAGTHLDPKIVEAFLLMEPDLTRGMIQPIPQTLEAAHHYAMS